MRNRSTTPLQRAAKSITKGTTARDWARDKAMKMLRFSEDVLSRALQQGDLEAACAGLRWRYIPSQSPAEHLASDAKGISAPAPLKARPEPALFVPWR